MSIARDCLNKPQYIHSKTYYAACKRLQDGKCTIELGFMLNDLLNNMERVSDHCSNVAACIIQLKDSAFATHEYLNEIKTSQDEEFKKEFEEYKNKYSLVNV